MNRRNRLCNLLFPVDEDTDAQEYALKDDEITSGTSELGDEKPGMAFMMKDGDNLADYSKDDPTPDSTDIEDAPVNGLEVESESWPIPPDSIEETPQSSVRVDIPPDPAPRAKPEWWTAAWNRLEGDKLSVIGRVEAVCRRDFKDDVTSMEITAFDCRVFRFQIDPVTGERIEAHAENQLIGGVVGVVWNSNHVTMTCCADRGKNAEESFVRNFANVLSLCPEGSTLTYWTVSNELVSAYDRIVQCREIGFAGLEESEMDDDCRRILPQMAYEDKRVQINRSQGIEIRRFREAGELYVDEMISRQEMVLGQSPDAYAPPTPPWS
jgi:hypothetical protein